jgi:hypothetical protein
MHFIKKFALALKLMEGMECTKYGVSHSFELLAKYTYF